jgi:hypothetical protein
MQIHRRLQSCATSRGWYAARVISPRVALALLITVATSQPAAAADWRPLFDGKSLSGWHPIGKGEWKVEDGVIVGRQLASEAEYGHLVTDAIVKDFTARFKFKSIKGNSGFYFRIAKAGFSGVTGFQAEIDPRNDVGGLYETNGRSWVVQPKPEQVKSWLRPDEWNEMSVSAQGSKIVVKVNGQTTAEIDDPQGRREGHIALQVHGGQECLVYFKDLEIQTGAGE